MGTANFRNVSLSLLLGLFTFHTYTVSTFTVSSKGLHVAYRGIASDVTCKLTTEEFKDSDTSCEYKVTNEFDPRTKIAVIKVVTKYKGVISSGQKKIDIKDAEDFDKSEEFKSARKDFILSLVKKSSVTAKENRIAEENEKALSNREKAFENSKIETAAEKKARKEKEAKELAAKEEEEDSSTPEITMPDGDENNEVASDDDEIDEDDISDILAKYKETKALDESCKLAKEDSKDLNKLSKKYRRLLRLSERSLKRKIKKQPKYMGELADLGEALDDIEENTDLDSSDDFKALLDCESKSGQLAYYDEHIRPAYSQALVDGNEETLRAMHEDQGLTDLLNANPSIKKSVDLEIYSANSLKTYKLNRAKERLSIQNATTPQAKALLAKAANEQAIKEQKEIESAITAQFKAENSEEADSLRKTIKNLQAGIEESDKLRNDFFAQQNIDTSVSTSTDTTASTDATGTDRLAEIRAAVAKLRGEAAVIRVAKDTPAVRSEKRATTARAVKRRDGSVGVPNQDARVESSSIN